MDHAHPELGQRPQKRHLLGDDLAGGKERHRLLAMFVLDRLEPGDERVERGLPRPPAPAFPARSAAAASVARSSALQRRQRLPALGTGHAEVDRVVGRGERLMACPSLRCTLRPQPVEQKPHTVVVVASGLSRGRDLAEAERAGLQQQVPRSAVRVALRATRS